MNRRGFLALGLKAAVLGVALSTGLARASLELSDRSLAMRLWPGLVSYWGEAWTCL